MVTPTVNFIVSDPDQNLRLLYSSKDDPVGFDNSSDPERELLVANNSNKIEKSGSTCSSNNKVLQALSSEDFTMTTTTGASNHSVDAQKLVEESAITSKMKAPLDTIMVETAVLTETSATSTEENDHLDDDDDDHTHQSPQPLHEVSVVSVDDCQDDDDLNFTSKIGHNKEGHEVDMDSLVASTENIISPDGGPCSTSTSPPRYYRLNAFHQDSSSANPDDSHHADNKNDLLSAALGDDAPSTTSSPHLHDPLSPAAKKARNVRFKDVTIREYDVTIGDNPYCSYGVPICLDWEYTENDAIPVDFFEASQKRRRNTRRMLLNSFQRRDMLWRAGHELEEIEKAIKATEKEKFRRSVTLYFLPLFQIQELLYLGAEKVFGEEKKDSSQSCEEQVRLLHHMQLAGVEPEEGGMAPWRQQAEVSRQQPRLQRRVSFRGSSAPNNCEQGGSIQSDEGFVSSVVSTDGAEDPYQASHNSKFKRYAVRVDHHQHDKSTEIVLCNIQRPHMRAFHAAWFAFFVAFMGWFAITPLLGEVKTTLDLTKTDIWTSSLCGTASTIIIRISMGPLCDKFGARICMACILATSAIPIALTGLVQTAAGLSTTRAFIGIAGSSFVACQYWTSQMFTREVAGTANALVAGWGNLGGGVTQIMMGSALFPLFKFFFQAEDFDGDDTTSSEMAWRTVFVVPALLQIAVAYAVWWHCDDSPKGDYRERLLQEQILVVSPGASLCVAAQNWNVWILLFQYACCFGVEVTMTNATALYFTETFGQSTVSAAAIASTFGFMNLFARGLGGLGSDLCNSQFGLKGRLAWQMITLFLEGLGIILFGFADSLGGSICALIFLSCMVQSSEGSTFGIVPYVDKRFTGAVVGWVGAGGNVGGVIFAVLFRQFSYRTAFSLMGSFACASAFLSLLMNVKSLARMQMEEERKQDDAFDVTQAVADTFAKEEI